MVWQLIGKYHIICSSSRKLQQSYSIGFFLVGSHTDAVSTTVMMCMLVANTIDVTRSCHTWRRRHVNTLWLRRWQRFLKPLTKNWLRIIICNINVNSSSPPCSRAFSRWTSTNQFTADFFLHLLENRSFEISGLSSYALDALTDHNTINLALKEIKIYHKS